MKKIDYDADNLTSFENEWLIHKNCREWWYATGILFDNEKNMYSYQYTLLNICFGIFTAKTAMLALTDYKNNKHYYLQHTESRKEKLVVTKDEASFGNIISAKKCADCIKIALHHKNFDLSLDAEYGKGAFWHCDNGKLQMGIPGKKETTLYYSYTNMPTKGTLVLNGKTLQISGKTWFDKQGGTYSIQNPKTNWEWFSLRFFDDEEMMLFTFPQNHPPYFDGTYIDKNRNRERLTNYKIEHTQTVKVAGMLWSAGWKLHLELKDKDYIIEPVQQGHINFAYFEEMCYIKDASGKLVGYAFAELLPGVLNGKDSGNTEKITLSNLFKNVEY